MNKSNYFFGQAVFGQLISLIDSDLIKGVVKKHNSDYYTKKFSTSDQLISMLFSSFANCSSFTYRDTQASQAKMGVFKPSELLSITFIQLYSSYQISRKSRKRLAPRN